MPSLFAGLAAVASVTVDQVFGEGFRHIPMTPPPAIGAGGRPDVNARRQANPTGPAQDFTGTFVAPGALVHARGRAMAERTTHAIQADTPMIDVDAGGFRTQPQRGDRIVRLDTGEVFEVSRMEPVDFGRAWLHLNDGHAPEPRP